MGKRWPRLLQQRYRREPIAALVLTMGLVQVTIGGADSDAGLAALGLIFLGTAAALYWLKYSARVIDAARSPRMTYRSSSASRLPVLPAAPRLTSVYRDPVYTDRSQSPLPPLRLRDRPNSAD